jgi:phage terminase small subunit
MPGETKLTAKQELFVKEYLIDLNATQAAIRAGYSEKTAEVLILQRQSKQQWINERPS